MNPEFTNEICSAGFAPVVYQNPYGNLRKAKRMAPMIATFAVPVRSMLKSRATLENRAHLFSRTNLSTLALHNEDLLSAPKILEFVREYVSSINDHFCMYLQTRAC